MATEENDSEQFCEVLNPRKPTRQYVDMSESLQEDTALTMTIQFRVPMTQWEKPNNMPGSSKTVPVSVNEVVWAFLNAERRKPEVEKRLGGQAWMTRLLHNRDFTSARENHLRLTALLAIRELLWTEIPADVVWYQVCFTLDASDEARLHTPWPTTEVPVGADPNKVPMDHLIAICHSATGAWTILKGNHRMSQWRRNGRPPTRVLWYVGQTSTSCRWIADDDVPPMHPHSLRLYHEHILSPAPPITLSIPASFPPSKMGVVNRRRWCIATSMLQKDDSNQVSPFPSVLVGMIDEYLWTVHSTIPLQTSTFARHATSGLLILGSRSTYVAAAASAPLAGAPEIGLQNRWAAAFIHQTHLARGLPLADVHVSLVDCIPSSNHLTSEATTGQERELTHANATLVSILRHLKDPRWSENNPLSMLQWHSSSRKMLIFAPDKPPVRVCAVYDSVMPGSFRETQMHKLEVAYQTDICHEWRTRNCMPPAFIAIGPLVLRDSLEWHRVLDGLHRANSKEFSLVHYLRHTVAGRQWREEASSRPDCFLVIWTYNYAQYTNVHDRLFLVVLP